MAELGFLDAIGLVGNLIGLISFAQSNFPKAEDPQGAKIQIKAGLGDTTSSELGGKISAVHGYDFNNKYLGKAKGGSMEDGGIIEVTIDQDVPGVQADYISIENSNDAVCIAWVSVKQHDGSPGGAWTGDIGSNCGQTWFYGNQVAGKMKDSNDLYKPKCAWFDGDHTNGFPSAAFKFRTRAYGESAEDTVKNNQACESTIFAADAAAIEAAPAKRSLPTSPTPLAPPSAEWVHSMMVTSNFTAHTSKELCESQTSFGPDFIGSDGMFCDMTTKTLTPLCSVQNIDGCINVDEQTKTVTKRSTIARRTVHKQHKTYVTVDNWK